jgi:hypothetical protein
VSSRVAVIFVLLAAMAAAGARVITTTGSPRSCARAQGRPEGAPAAQPDPSGARALYSGPSRELEGACKDRPGHPESFLDLARANSARLTRTVAPGAQIRAGAYRSAVAHAADLPRTGGTWHPYGRPPLVGDRTQYDTSDGSTNEGLPDLSGRASGFARSDDGVLYAAISNGGIWRSTDGTNWSSIGEGLPTQVVSSVVWTPAGGGTVLALTGDNAYGGDTYAGQGVYRTTDDGAHWQHADGIPDGLLGFKLAVDPTDPQKIYAATGGGLYRSTDGGASFDNVNLPTGAGATAPTPNCSGKPPTAKDCFLANMVTDVVVQGARNTQTAGGHPGAVMAAVGWRAGTKTNADGAVQSPGNGIYVSTSGAPGTFKNMDLASHNQPTAPYGTDPLTQARIGRIALGIAAGPAQNHQVVYALVQDAVKFNGGIVGVGADEGSASPAYSDYLNAVWVSTDFGATWKELEGSTAIDNDTSSGSALAPPTCKTPALIGYCPGIQAWYNLWVSPDPTRATASGIPTRLAFGLEEIWANDPNTASPNGLDGSTSQHFNVVGRYYGNQSCTLLNATNGLPVCPAAQGGQTPPTTTHPDQHGVLWVPDGAGGVTLFAGNDGGIFNQHLGKTDELSNTKWGRGANHGLNTLQPYDAEMAKDGTLYMGLQDNGEGKIDPDGSMYTVFGGDGFFTAVDPDNANTAYEEYTGGDIHVTKDGGKTWTDILPDNLTSAQFSTPFQMDPANASHLMIGGRDIEETTSGPDTTSSSWTKVYDLGTRTHRGDANASSSGTDPDNQLSAVDVRGFPDPGATGPRTPDFAYTGGSGTVPGGDDVIGDASTFPPGTYTDHKFSIGPTQGDKSMTVRISWANDLNDWDLYVYKVAADGSMQLLGSSANGGTDFEQVSVSNPAAGNYVIRVANFTAVGTFNAKATFTQRAPSDPATDAAYVGFCGFCDTITQGTPFANGLATNVNSGPGVALSSAGWHIATAKGLPSRYITSARMDPADPRTVYVTLAGYGRRWAFPGAVGEDTSKIGTGHVFKSTDAGQTFTDVTGDLPDVPANWTVLHNGHLVVGTDIGVYESCDTAGGAYSALGDGLPAAPISTLRFKPGDDDLLVAATYGRGVYTYRFGDDTGRCGVTAAAAKAISLPSAKRCSSRRSFRIRLRDRRHLKIRRVTVYVNRKRVKKLTGRHITTRINLRNLPKGTYTVTVRVTPRHGRTLVDVRRYHTCVAKKKHTLPGHHTPKKKKAKTKKKKSTG